MILTRSVFGSVVTCLGLWRQRMAIGKDTHGYRRETVYSAFPQKLAQRKQTTFEATPLRVAGYSRHRKIMR